LKVHNGFLLVNKPSGLSSFDIIRKMRGVFACKKIGHAGTLDPLAEGLLILAFGSATRLLQFLDTEPKVYLFEIQFGSETDTLDKGGKVVCSGGSIPLEDALRCVIPEFIGTLQQTPPVFSAVKIGGRRAYALARKGISPEIKPRTIIINSLLLLDYNAESGKALFEVNCSGGTYVRSLARDIAHRLHTFGYAGSITRRSCGRFSTENAMNLNDINSSTKLLPIDSALEGIPVIQATAQILDALSYGRDIIIPSEREHVIVFAGDEFVALVNKTVDNLYHPAVVATLEEGKPADVYS
jgi:tRNA pseudouridine55 synthase